MNYNRIIPDSGSQLDPNFTFYVLGRFILSLGFLLAGIYALHKGFDLYSNGVGIERDGSHVAGKGDTGEVDISLKSVGSVVMMTSIVWGIIAYFTLPRGKYQGSNISLDAARRIASALKEQPSKEYLESLFTRPMGVEPDFESREFKHGEERARERLKHDGHLMLILYTCYPLKLEIDDKNRCLFFEVLRKKYSVRLNENGWPCYPFGHSLWPQGAAGFNSVMLAAIKERHGEDVLIRAAHDSTATDFRQQQEGTA